MVQLAVFCPREFSSLAHSQNVLKPLYFFLLFAANGSEGALINGRVAYLLVVAL